MLNALPQVLTPSALAAADSLGTAPRSSAEGSSGFAALMQRQSELRVSDLRLSDLRLSDLHSTEQRLAEQRQSQVRHAEPGAAELHASIALQNGPGKPPGSGAGAEHASGDTNINGGRSAAPDDTARLNAGTGTANTRSTPSSAGPRPLDNSTESRNAASQSLNGKLQRARNAAPDATRQAAAAANPPRAGARDAPNAAAEQDSGSAPADAHRPDEPLPDPTAAAAATSPLPTAAVPDAQDMIQRSDSLSAPGRVSLVPLPVASSAAEVAGPSGSSRSTAGWVADQQRLRGAGTSRPAAPNDAGLAERVATAPDPAAGQPTTSDAGLAADLLAPAPAGTRPSAQPGTVPGTVPGDVQAGALAGTAAAPTAAAADAGVRQRGAALPGTPEGSGPQDAANTRRSGAASNRAPDLPGQPDQANAGSGVRRASTVAPAARPVSPAADPTTRAAQTPGGMPTRAADALIDDSASTNASASQRAHLIDSGDHTGSNSGSNTDSSAVKGSVTEPPATVPAEAVAWAGGDQAARQAGEPAAVHSGAKVSTLAASGAGQWAGQRSVETAGADSLPGQGVRQAGDVAAPGDRDGVARLARSSQAPARTGAGAATAVPTSPSPVAGPTLASNPASAPTDSSASASEFSNASTSAAQRAGPVAGADPRRALATAAGPDGAAVSLRPAAGERVATLGHDGANSEAIDPAALPANRRAAEPAKTAAPLASDGLVSLPASAAAANGAGLDNGLSRHPGQSVAASDGGPTGPATPIPAAAPALAPHRSDATGPSTAPVEARIALPLDSPAFAPALGAQISLFARDGVQTARLQLNPAEMGPIAVQIAVDGNAARIDFQADRAATREVIEASLPALAGALQDAGLTLTGGGVFQQHPGRQAPPEPGPAPAAARLPASATGLDAVAGSLAASSRQRTPRGLVDLVA